MSSLKLAAIMTALSIGSGGNFDGYSNPYSVREPREPREPSDEELSSQEKTISAAEEKRKRKAEKRLKQFNK